MPCPDRCPKPVALRGTSVQQLPSWAAFQAELMVQTNWKRPSQVGGKNTAVTQK